MSIEVSAAVWRHAPVYGSTRLLLLALADFADEDGGCWPSIATLADRAGCSERTAQRGLAEMEAEGFIAIEAGAGPRGCNRYFVRVEAIRAASRTRVKTPAGRPEAGAKRAVDEADSGAGTGAGTGFECAADVAAGGDILTPPIGAEGVTFATGGVTPVTGGGDMGVTRTVIEPSKDPSIERERARDDEKRALIAMRRVHADWPTRITDSEPAAFKAWQGLDEAQREASRDGIARYVAASKAEGRKLVCSFAVYLGEKRWERLAAAPAGERAALPEGAAPAGGPVWAARLMGALIAGVEHPDRLRPLPLDAEGRPMARPWFNAELQAAWPLVAGLRSLLTGGGAARIYGPRWHRLAAAMEPVPVDGWLWPKWREEFARRGWPAMPEPDHIRAHYMPALPEGGGCADALEAFAARLAGLDTAAGEAAAKGRAA